MTNHAGEETDRGRASSARSLAALLRPRLFVTMLLLATILPLSACGTLSALTSSSSPRTISGKLRDASGPIAGARVELTSYQSDRCVSLARSTNSPSEQEKQELGECVRRIAEAVTDEAGTYTFSNVRPGSYDLTIVWALRPGQAVPTNPVFTQDEYAVVIVTNSDGTWTVTARGEIMTLAGQGDAIHDFSFQPPDR